MALVGYARVSSVGQSLDVQLDKLQHCDKIYQEKKSGTIQQRSKLDACLEYVREGDTLVVSRLDRLARSTLICVRLPTSSSANRSLCMSWIRILIRRMRLGGCCLICLVLLLSLKQKSALSDSLTVFTRRRSWVFASVANSFCLLRRSLSCTSDGHKVL
jgi:hypothetical protein